MLSEREENELSIALDFLIQDVVDNIDVAENFMKNIKKDKE